MTKTEIINKIKKYNKAILYARQLEKNETNFDLHNIYCEQASIIREVEGEQIIQDMTNYLKSHGFICCDGKFIDDLTISEMIKLCNIIK